MSNEYFAVYEESYLSDGMYMDSLHSVVKGEQELGEALFLIECDETCTGHSFSKVTEEVFNKALSINDYQELEDYVSGWLEE